MTGSVGPLSRLASRPLWAAVVVFFLALAGVAGATWYRYRYHGPIADFQDRLLFEAYGAVLDILVLGGFVLWVNRRGRHMREISRYTDEIDDFRNWRFQEAAYRITGNIRRLNRHGISVMDLSRCTLRNMDLNGANLQGACLVSADLHGAYLSKAQLRESDLNGAVLKFAFLWKADLTRAILVGADMREANLEGADLSGAFLQGADFQNANLAGSVLREAKGLAADQLVRARTLFNAVLPPDIEKAVRETHPRLLESGA